MIYKCKNAVLDMRQDNNSSAFFVDDNLMFIGSSTIAMKYFVDHCGTDIESKTLTAFRERLAIRGKLVNI